MNISGGSCGSPSSTESLPAGDLFKELWSKLKECHDKELQELLLKIAKLKKQRCLDAQRLEEFYTKNKQLREQQKVLHDTIKVLEDRLRAGLCDRCAVTEEHMRKKQQEFENIRQQNLKLITELMNDKNTLQDENKRLSEQLKHMQKTDIKQITSDGPTDAGGDCEDGIIPDSPVSSFPLSMVSRMRRRKENQRVRYTEQAQEVGAAEPSSSGSVLRTPTQANVRKGEDILVAETCDMEQSSVSNKQGEKPFFNLAAVVAETLGLEAHEDSQSQSVLNHPRADAHKQEEHSPRLAELAYTDNSQDNPHGMEWGTQQASPVFGASPVLNGNSTDADTSTSVLMGIKSKLKFPYYSRTSDSPLQKTKALSEDATVVVPVCLGAEADSVISGYSGNRQPNVSIIDVINTNDNLSTKNTFDRELYKPTKNRYVKRRKADSDEEVSCDISVNKENNGPYRTISLDKPLDLSDRFSGLHPRESSHNSSSANVIPLNAQDSLKLGSKKNSSFGNLHGSSLLHPDLKQDPHLQEPQEQALGSNNGGHYENNDETEDDKLLFDDLKTGSTQEPRRKGRTVNRGCELTSVLQPNPHMVQAKVISLNNGPSTPPLDNMPWSIDPGADLSQYKMDYSEEEEAKDEVLGKTEQDDMDYTYVSDSMLLKMRKQELIDSDTPPEESKENDSFEEMFDKTECGDYVSYLHEKRLEVDGEHEVSALKRKKGKEREADGKEVTHRKQKAFIEPYFQSPERKRSAVDYPHIEVVRNKEERRKMLGHTCKECEIYYADLPEEERAKKLASCSRHRFRYIPPSTPENFWEVGFPSTQTCKDRGYIKEELSPCQRPRRRQPYNVMFSPKGKEQKT
ncbi:DNA endonuclease RBBP8 [Spea bombifrons]|uniref:DNA endonuclease RBBP8 n=1 Tax=Spea bombifrons TaxID=233779 RepID=UPI00234B180C|nr:DNA endonuclease RBBP8 [Spea bombifrons]XP_053323933.1 DNA endonuclease RBBP8 [Spea bombifrons]